MIAAAVGLQDPGHLGQGLQHARGPPPVADPPVFRQARPEVRGGQVGTTAAQLQQSAQVVRPADPLGEPERGVAVQRRVEQRGGPVRVAPVAAEQHRPPHQDLALGGNLTTESRQLLVSGIYIAVIEDHTSGDQSTLKFTVIR